WALFSDPRLALAVARGSGEAVRQLSEVAQQAGNDVSAHGTGGAWMIATAQADADRFEAAVHASLDRKVCNTLNTCAIVRERADELVPRFLAALDRAAADRGGAAKLHVLDRDRDAVPAQRFTTSTSIDRADGPSQEPQAEVLTSHEQLGIEWEWEGSPEVTLLLVDGLDEGLELFNRHSPRFVLSVISEDADEQRRAFADADAPYVGDGFTRWVDGQYALGTPELGLSNWERGRLFHRSGILSGASIHTVRLRVEQSDPTLHR
ncbi:MAG: glutamate-5-semialdehyde dehydrogenase, partial [Nitriliruptoraceae bacterium]